MNDLDSRMSYTYRLSINLFTYPFQEHLSSRVNPFLVKMGLTDEHEQKQYTNWVIVSYPTLLTNLNYRTQNCQNVLPNITI